MPFMQKPEFPNSLFGGIEDGHHEEACMFLISYMKQNEINFHFSEIYCKPFCLTIFKFNFFIKYFAERLLFDL